MKFCTKCGTVISDNEILCEIHSKEANENKAEYKKKTIPFIIIFVLIFTVMIYVFSSNYLHKKALNDRINAVNKMAEDVDREIQLYRDRQLTDEVSKGKNGNPTLGMTKTQVEKTSWGAPKDINRTITKYGINEQWVYRDGKYLYFENNILVSIQD